MRSQVVTTCLLVVLYPTTALAVDVPFGAKTNVATLSNGRWIETADLDADGDLDLLVAGESGAGVWWVENLGGGSWYPRTVGSVSGGSTITSGDVDGDGDLDVLASSRFDDSVSWFENAGGASAWTTHTVSTAHDDAQSVFAVDMDGDGDTDVLAASLGDNKIAWHENANGLGTSWVERPISTIVSRAHLIYSADLDGDGDMDVLSGGQFDDYVRWFENANGAGTSWTSHLVGAMYDARDVIAADLDGDGDLDVAAASPSDDTVSWFENLSGDASSWSAHALTTTLIGAHTVFARDVDKDGDLDLLTTDVLDDEVEWWENTVGDASTFLEHVVATGVTFAQAATAADLDGDGDMDLASVARDDAIIYTHENVIIHRSGSFDATAGVDITTTESPRALYAADVDGDGDRDVLTTGGFSDNEVLWFENSAGDGSSWIEHGVYFSATGSFSSALSAVDMDRDGDTDVIAAYSASASDDLAWYENTAGDGSAFTRRPISSSGIDFPQSAHPGDIDGDGDPDVVLASYSDNRVSWFENLNGVGTSWSGHKITTSALGVRVALPADVDGDGDLDVATASTHDSTVGWWENTTGAGTGMIFHSVATVSSTTTVDAADIDRDGDLDLVSASTTSDAIAWYENVGGSGTTWSTHSVTIRAASTPRMVVAADVDCDGDPDILSTSDGGTQQWWENTAGNGTSWSPHTVATGAGFSFLGIAADLDADGDLDALTTSPTPSRLRWYENRGGQYALLTTDTSSPPIYDGQSDAILQVDAAHRGRTGDADVELVRFRIDLLDETGTIGLTATRANDIIEEVRLYRDDGSGALERGVDTLVTSVSSFSTIGQGRVSLDFLDGAGNAAIAPVATERYFVDVELTADASSHETGFSAKYRNSISAGEDRDHDLPLIIEHHADLVTQPLVIPEPEQLLLLASGVVFLIVAGRCRAASSRTPGGPRQRLVRD